MSKFLLNNDVETKNRFDSARFFAWSSNLYDTMDSQFIDDLRALPSYGTITITNQAFRPDLISRDIYGSNGFWNVIKIYNGIIRDSQLVEGVRLNYPSLNSLEQMYFSYTTRQRAQEV